MNSQQDRMVCAGWSALLIIFCALPALPPGAKGRNAFPGQDTQGGLQIGWHEVQAERAETFDLALSTKDMKEIRRTTDQLAASQSQTAQACSLATCLPQRHVAASSMACCGSAVLGHKAQKKEIEAVHRALEA